MTIRRKILLLATMPLIIIIVLLSLTMKFQFDRLSDQQITAYSMSLYNQKDDELQNYTQLAMTAIEPFLNDPNLDEAEAKARAKSVLTALAYSNDGYFFVYDYEGESIVHPTQPFRVGKNWIDLEDTAGNKVIQDLIALSKTGGGYYSYRWNNPATKQDAEKKSYALPIEKWNWFVGTGIYLDKIDAHLARQKAEFALQSRQSLWRNAAIASFAILTVFGLVFYMNFHELGHADAKLRMLNREILSAQEDERRRVSRELHDSISQMLVSVKYSFEHSSLNLAKLETSKNAKNLNLVQKGMNEGISRLLEATQEVRRISHALRPSQLDDLGLGPALENLSNEFQERTDIATSVDAPRFKGTLPENIKIALYRICQEALTNIDRHAQATDVQITVKRLDGEIMMNVIDNGIGLTQSKLTALAMGTPGKGKGLGLTNMSERIEAWGGKLGIHSSKAGTHLTIQIPVNYLPLKNTTTPLETPNVT